MAPSAPGPDSAANPKCGKRNLLEDSDSDSEGGAQIEDLGFKVNEEYARRFEHNKKREETQRLEEKYKKTSLRAAEGGGGDESSSSSESEDDDGFLATEDLDAQISATLHAIRTKDPRVYDKNVTFVQLPDDEMSTTKRDKKEEPVFLRDYHRERILRGDIGASDDEDSPPQTYSQEQATLKKSIVSEIKAATCEDGSDNSGDDDFVKLKEPEKSSTNGVHPSAETGLKVSEFDVASAGENPETFLSNFMAARAWIPQEGGKWKAFESDDGDDDGMADEWEQAYNMRFENPAQSNEVLRSYARDLTAARSVRRGQMTVRKRQRELERERREAEKDKKREEKARLRKLKLEETEQKLRKVKLAAGAVGKELTEEEWMKFLDDAWEDDKWEEEMRKRFGEEYYAMKDEVAKSDEEDGGDSGNKKRKKHPKKPKWDDDIDITDIIPDFGDEANPPITLSGDEGEGVGDQDGDGGGDGDARPSKKRKVPDSKRARLESQKAARLERTKLKALVDSKLELTNHDLLTTTASSSRSSGGAAFRYRQTSPQSFGMTARDILLAPSDVALNDFAGLKKLASFRDEDKKRRDRKRLGKKARLRDWRRSVFGPESEMQGPTYGFERLAHVGDASEPPVPPRPDAKMKPKEAADGRSREKANVGDEAGRSRKRKRRSTKDTKTVRGEAS